MSEIKIKDVVCEDCGSNDSSVRVRFCPYFKVVLNEDILITICDECFNKRESSISNPNKESEDDNREKSKEI